MAKRLTKSGAELDVVEHRKHLNWQRGEVRKLKRQMNRRERREARREIRLFQFA